MTQIALIVGLTTVLVGCGAAFGAVQKKAASRNAASRRAHLKARARSL